LLNTLFIRSALDFAGAATTEAERKKYYGEVQKIVAVAQPTLTGLHLNAVGDFESLKDVIKLGS
jgi:hypothetical protein